MRPRPHSTSPWNSAVSDPRVDSTRTAAPARSGTSSAAKSAPSRWVVQRRQPTVGPRQPTSDAADGGPDEEIG